MEMVGPLAEAIGLLDDIVGLVKNVKAVFSKSDVFAALEDLRARLVSAQNENLALQSKNRELLEQHCALQEELRRLKDFKLDAKKYVLCNVGTHTHLYAPKKRGKNTDPTHYLCPNCYHDHRKSVLQFSRRELRHDVLACPHCKAEFHIEHGQPPTIATTGSRYRIDDY